MLRRHRLTMTPPQTTQGRDAGYAVTPAAMSSERVREGCYACGVAACGWTRTTDHSRCWAASGRRSSAPSRSTHA
jgi:hypothetical protein